MIKAKKSLGQNFLIDSRILEKITNTAKIQNKIILEVGPGTGNLTSCILKNKPKKMIVIEKDKDLANDLEKKFKNQITIINEDILKIDETRLFKDKVTVFGNLPYNISTKIIANWCLMKNVKFKKLVLMFQKEVADRIIAKVNTQDYSRITILTNWKFSIKKITDINPDCFFPKPKIKSTLLEFTPKKNLISINNPKNVEHISRIFFNHRRKMIKKNFIRLFKNFDVISKKIDIKLTDRPQHIPIDKFLMIIKEYEKNLN